MPLFHPDSPIHSCSSTVTDNATLRFLSSSPGSKFIFQQLHAAGRTIIFVTHNPEIAQYSSRNITLRDGRVTGDVRNAAILDAAETLAQLPEQED